MRKTHLPSKICAVCGLPFSWRKKWEKNWDDVKYCSERCRRSKSTAKIHERPKSTVEEREQSKSTAKERERS